MNPNKAAPTIPPANSTINAMNESTRVRIYNSHLSVLVFPSHHQDDVTLSFASTFSIGQNVRSEPPEAAVGNGSYRTICYQYVRHLNDDQPIGVWLHADKTLCSIDFMAYRHTVSGLGFHPLALTQSRIKSTRLFKPAVPKKDLCLCALIPCSPVRIAIENVEET